MFAAPSPKLQIVTCPVPRSIAASARPVAIGAPAPTMPVVTISPDRGSERCIGPPLPLDVPVSRPYISAMISGSGVPLATMSWMQRVMTLRSVGASTAAIAAGIASWPPAG